MNLILLSEEEAFEGFLPWKDPRGEHIRKILKLAPGERFSVGCVPGKQGTALVTAQNEEGLRFSVTWTGEEPPLIPVTLLVGLVRPPTARRLLKDMTTFGVEHILFTGTDLSEKSYRNSKLWTTDQWERAVLDGAQQGVSARRPRVDLCWSLKEALDHRDPGPLVVLDNGRPGHPIGEVDLSGGRVTCVIGPERGWSDREREILGAAGGRFCRMGRRVLRTETACPAALGILFSRLGFYAE